MDHREDTLSRADFKRLSGLIYDESGIRLGDEKKTMLEGRLRRRLRTLNLTSYGEYCEYLFSCQERGPELIELVDAVTTNKTDFFREKAHFDFLVERALPEFTSRHGTGRPLRVWSAGCSTGEEPYTLAIVLSEYRDGHPGFRFSVLATDISTVVLKKAQLGVFRSEAVAPVAKHLQRKYFMRSRDPDSNLVRVVPELRALVDFQRLNLMEEFGLAELVDIIFCRNVVIYFDRPTQQRLFAKFGRQLVDGGHLFVGHSESLHTFNLPLLPVAPALYRKENARTRN